MTNHNTPKFYTGEEIEKDIQSLEGIPCISLTRKDDILSFYLYSDVNKRSSNLATVNDLQEKINTFIFNYTFPLVDFTNNTNKDIVVMSETFSNTEDYKAKILFSFDYKDKLKKPLTEDNESEELYKNLVINRIFDDLEKYVDVTKICIVDFHTSTVTKLLKNKQ